MTEMPPRIIELNRRPGPTLLLAAQMVGGACLLGVMLGLILLAVVILPQLDWTTAEGYIAARGWGR